MASTYSGPMVVRYGSFSPLRQAQGRLSGALGMTREDGWVSDAARTRGWGTVRCRALGGEWTEAWLLGRRVGHRPTPTREAARAVGVGAGLVGGVLGAAEE